MSCDPTWLEDREEAARAQAEQGAQREAVSKEVGGRTQVLHVLNPNANIARGKGLQGSGRSVSPLGIGNQGTEQLRNAEQYLTVLVKYAKVGLKRSLARVNRDQYSVENSTASPPPWDVPRGTSHWAVHVLA